MDKIQDFQAFGEADDTAVSKEASATQPRLRLERAQEAWFDSARACKKLGGLCFDFEFDYCEENFKLVGSIFFLKTENLLQISTSICESDGRKYGL